MILLSYFPSLLQSVGRLSHYNLDWPGPYFVAEASFKLVASLPVLAFQILGLQVYVTIPSSYPTISVCLFVIYFETGS